MKDLIRFLSYTEGRDKVYKNGQYTARLILWYYSRYGGAHSRIETVQNLEAALTTSRKLFRMARSLDFFQKVLDALSKPHSAETMLEVVGCLGKVVWLLVDHWLWLGKIKIIETDAAKWSQRAAYFRCIANTSLSLRDLIKLQNLLHRAKELKRAGDPVPRKQLKEEIRKTQMQFVVDFADLLIPLGTLGYCNKGVSAAGGIVASATGGYMVWQKYNSK